MLASSSNRPTASSASSALGISGTVELIGPPVDLNGLNLVARGGLLEGPESARPSHSHSTVRSATVDRGCVKTAGRTGRYATKELRPRS